jgi:hypothetical protein
MQPRPAISARSRYVYTLLRQFGKSTEAIRPRRIGDLGKRHHIGPEAVGVEWKIGLRHGIEGSGSVISKFELYRATTLQRIAAPRAIGRYKLQNRLILSI